MEKAYDDMSYGEKLQAKEEFSLRNLTDKYIVGVALSEVIKSKALGDYGTIVSDKAVYAEATNGEPGAHAYETLLKPLIQSEEAQAHSQELLSKKALQILKESIMNVSVDNLGALGIKIDTEANPEFKGKYVADLSDDQKAAVVISYLGNVADARAVQDLKQRPAMRAKSLEAIFNPKKESVFTPKEKIYKKTG